MQSLHEQRAVTWRRAIQIEIAQPLARTIRAHDCLFFPERPRVHPIAIVVFSCRIRHYFQPLPPRTKPTDVVTQST
jgi:hypothetical protein